MSLRPGLGSTFEKTILFFFRRDFGQSLLFSLFLIHAPCEYKLARQVSVQLVEASDHIMGSFDEKLIDYTTGLLKNRKVSCKPTFSRFARPTSYPLFASYAGCSTV